MIGAGCRGICLSVLLALAGEIAWAQTPQAQPEPPVLLPVPELPQPKWVQRDIALVRVLDKTYARAEILRVKVGQSARLGGGIDIAALACAVRPPEQPADAAAFLVVTAAASGAVAFRGWMFAARPTVAMLEHPLYDVRVVGCGS